MDNNTTDILSLLLLFLFMGFLVWVNRDKRD